MLRYITRSIAVVAFVTVIVGCSSTRSDEAITTDVQSRMFADAQAKSANISVAVDHGSVTLTGQVPDDATRNEAFKVAQQTPGVKNVYDRMAIQQQAASISPAPPAAPVPEPPPANIPVRPTARERRLERQQKQEALRRESTKPREQARAAIPPPALTQSQYQTPQPQTASPALAPVPQASVPVAEPVPTPIPQPPPPPQPVRVEIPSGTPVRVQLIDPVDTSVNHAGDVFRASLAAPIVVDDQAVVPAGTDVFVKLVDASSAGRIKGQSSVQLQLAHLDYQGTSYSLASDDYTQAGGSRGKRTAETIGGGAAVGAIIGAIAGGGKGAAIGAGVGGAGGTAVQAATHGEQVRLAAETKLDFTLQAPVNIHYFPDKNRR